MIACIPAPSTSRIDVRIDDVGEHGLRVQDDGEIQLARVRISKALGRGLFVDDGAKLRGSEVWISNVTTGLTGGAVGLDVSEGATAIIADLTVIGAKDEALRVSYGARTGGTRTPLVELRGGTLATSGVAVSNFLNPSDRGNVVLEDVRLIGNAVDAAP